jgi:hypothetical protein
MVMAVTKRARMARAMVMAMRVPVYKEARATRAIALTRVACNKEGEGNGGKSNGDKGGGLLHIGIQHWILT